MLCSVAYKGWKTTVDAADNLRTGSLSYKGSARINSRTPDNFRANYYPVQRQKQLYLPFVRALSATQN